MEATKRNLIREEGLKALPAPEPLLSWHTIASLVERTVRDLGAEERPARVPLL